MYMRIGAIIGLVVALGPGCKSSEAPRESAPSAPVKAASSAEAPADPAEGASTPGAEASAPGAPSAEAPAAPATGAGTGEAAPPTGAPPPGETGADCEESKRYDEVSIATQQAAIARMEATKAAAVADEADQKARELLVAAMRRHATACASRTLDAICVGGASGDPSRCQGAEMAESVAACKLIALLRQAVVAKNPAICAGIPDKSIHAMCVGAAGGEFECSDDDEEGAVVCRQMRDHESPSCEADQLEQCKTYWTVTALMKQDEVPCGRIPEPSARNHCRAIATGDVSLCTARGDVPETCRDVVLESFVEQVPAPDGTRFVARVRAVNLYAQTARCRARLDLRIGESETQLDKDLGALAPGGDVRDYTWGLEGLERKPVLSVSTTCAWDPVAPTAPVAPAPAPAP